MMKKNDLIELTIDGASSDGAGIGRAEGAAVFVPGATIGDRCRVRIVKVEKNLFRGRLEQILVPSPDRITPACLSAGKCGGCAYQHIRYEAELKLKEERVRACLERIGGLHLAPQPIVPSPIRAGYRNKVILPVGERNGEPAIGFYAPRSHRIVDIEGCEIHHAGDAALAAALLDYMREQGVPPYCEETESGVVRHLFIRRLRSGEVCVMPVINADRLPNPERLVARMRAAEPGIVSILLNHNRRRGNVILGDRCTTLWGREYLEDTLCGLRFRISPRAFYQINTPQCEQLYAKVAEYAALTGEETVCDLYCGIGTIGLSLAAQAREVIGMEVVPDAVRDARRNAAQNGIHNARFFCGGAEDFSDVFHGAPDVCIVDPPRKGCDRKLIDTLVRMAPRRIVYVSCDPATLARDLKLFTGQGYEVREVTPFDMFPRSAHVETVVLLSKGEIDSKKGSG